MIINTGMRTDIPAFYHEWLINRIKEGFVLVRNPYNPSQVTRYSLSPEVVDLIAFCTKNLAPMLPHMDTLKPYGQYWFVTITPYGKDIEPNVPDKQKVMEDFKKLSDIVSIDSVGWRYDPIFVDDKHTLLPADFRLREGYVYVRNPYNMTYITKYTLHPSVVDLISFCSKNPKPMLKYLDLLRPYGMYWYVTITGYGRDIEPNVPDIPEVIETFKRLSEFAGIDSMGWRYDPIFLDDT